MATKSMLIMSQSMRKARNIDGFLMFDETKFLNRRGVRVDDAEEEAKLHEHENE